MKLYRAKVVQIAHQVIEGLVNIQAIEVESSNRSEAELDLVAIMEEYMRRDFSLREQVREYMAEQSVPYEQYGKIRGKLAEKWGHPTGDEVERFLSRQFIENFMISRFVDEVYSEDRVLYRAILDVLIANDVDEAALRTEAREQVRNIPEGTVDYEIALSKAIRDVKKRHGLIS